MASVEWLNSRPYYLNSSTTPFDFLWGSVWFLFDDNDFAQFSNQPLNLGCHLTISVEAELCDPPKETPLAPVFGRSEVWLYNRFVINSRGDVKNPHPAQETYRYSTDDGRIGIPFQLFNINTLQTFTQLSELTRRTRDQLMREVHQTRGRLEVQFEYTLQPDHFGPGYRPPPFSALSNAFLVQEFRHPGRFAFVDQPPPQWSQNSFLRDGFHINASWDASGEVLSVEWDSDATLKTGPNRYNRAAEFPGEKVFLP